MTCTPIATPVSVLSQKDPRLSALVAASLALHGLSTPAPAQGGWMVGL